MAGELTAKEKVVGLKQTRRAVTQGTARQVYLACDADPALTEPLLALCREKGLTTRIFGMGEDGAVTRALMGDEIGTLVTA